MGDELEVFAWHVVMLYASTGENRQQVTPKTRGKMAFATTHIHSLILNL